MSAISLLSTVAHHALDANARSYSGTNAVGTNDHIMLDSLATLKGDGTGLGIDSSHTVVGMKCGGNAFTFLA